MQLDEENSEHMGLSIDSLFDSSIMSKYRKYLGGKIMKKIAMMFLAVFAVTALAACSSGPYTVQLDTMGGDSLPSIMTDSNGRLNLPVPQKEGYVFTGWFSDQAYTNHVTTWSVVSNDDVILYARWEEKTDLPYSNLMNDTQPIVTIEIAGYGVIQLQLFPALAPNTVNNFLKYIELGYYNGVTFHTVAEDFMIQGGYVEEPLCAIAGEFRQNDFNNPVKHLRGIISMARTREFDSATSEFFILQTERVTLDGYNAAFGGMIGGFDVLDAIASVEVDEYGRPKEMIVITRITVNTRGINYGDPLCVN